MSPKVSATTRIRCQYCRYYFVTWEPARPHGCKRMGFKSRQLPSVVVRKNSGAACRGFEPNQPATAPNKGNHDI